MTKPTHKRNCNEVQQIGSGCSCVRLTVQQKRDRITAYDILEVIDEGERGKYDYLITLMTDSGTSPAFTWSNATVEREWLEGEYADPEGKSAWVHEHSHYDLVKDLWP